MKLFCRHKYVPIKSNIIEYVDDLFYPPKSHHVYKTKTKVWLRCSECGKVKSKKLDGTWTGSQLRRLYSGPEC